MATNSFFEARERKIARQCIKILTFHKKKIIEKRSLRVTKYRHR